MPGNASPPLGCPQPGLGQPENELLLVAVPLNLVSDPRSQDSHVASDDNPDILKPLRVPDQATACVALDVFLVTENVALVGRPLKVRVHQEPQGSLVSRGKSDGTTLGGVNYLLLG